MKTILDLLSKGNKKNGKYYVGNNIDVDSIKDAYSSNILNMKTVKEGTASAGAFCNRIMEIASNSCGSLDMVESRVISDIFQRIALDSKHDGNGGSYKDSDWYQIYEMMLKTKKGTSLEVIEDQLFRVLTGDVVIPQKIDTTNNADIDELMSMSI